ncbi:hypothetical protein COEREDRAFT_12798 [Coemansia reversa NRRL 1564]|uniref:Uncharacterized protein n=1 Tax=Coemansia reversa (strain ATCC 12441 / NRRL 1564) TaxID=763665 RepID=A0A2G5B0C6_COERN|nr:hypothetical protein COEREDRAFT_12798 [Coemansia reversa NRRL 1564]|eukprot:PIA12469.1 hypothetical protein COEREDRAFT_12798 [Coemansia reversa NRRL 1564]
MPMTRFGYRTGDWKAFLELRDGKDLPAHVALKSCEGKLAKVVPASELLRCHACGTTLWSRCVCALEDGAEASTDAAKTMPPENATPITAETGIPVTAIATPATLLAAESASADKERNNSVNKEASAADSSQAESAAPAAATAASPKGMQVPMSAGLITSIAMSAEHSAQQNDAGEAASPVAVTEQTSAHHEEDNDVYMSVSQNPLKRNNREESDNERSAAAAAQGSGRTAPSASGMHGVKTRARSKAVSAASDADPGSPRY